MELRIEPTPPNSAVKMRPSLRGNSSGGVDRAYQERTSGPSPTEVQLRRPVFV